MRYGTRLTELALNDNLKFEKDIEDYREYKQTLLD